MESKEKQQQQQHQKLGPSTAHHSTSAPTLWAKCQTGICVWLRLRLWHDSREINQNNGICCHFMKLVKQCKAEMPILEFMGKGKAQLC